MSVGSPARRIAAVFSSHLAIGLDALVAAPALGTGGALFLAGPMHSSHSLALAGCCSGKDDPPAAARARPRPVGQVLPDRPGRPAEAAQGAG
ncbi:hypothetical protein D3C76_1326350 [compost metagenome]